MPLGDSITLAAVRRDGIDYGRVRVWGSVSFILAAMASGAVLSRSAAGEPGGNAVLALVLVASVVLFVACVAIPAGAARAGGTVALGGARRLGRATAASGSSSPSPRRCRRATRSITGSARFTGARSAFPTR